MERQYLGIDLGTSSLKLLAVTPDGDRTVQKVAYRAPGVDGWLAALQEGFRALWTAVDPADIAGIGLSSQVGTYIAGGNGEKPVVIGWDSDAGREELSGIKALIPEEEFLRQIGMAHPDLISYPLPRLLYLKRHYPHLTEVIMPKELLLRALTGSTVTDPFSQRGIAHTARGTYAVSLMEKLGLSCRLPTLARPTDLAGRVTEEAAARYGLIPGTPVYVGCNDFFAGLLGMGVLTVGTAFDLSGTSEHVGIITESPVPGQLVSGGYLRHAVTYGGTKGSGPASAFAMRQFGLDGVTADRIRHKPPLFLPYLCGERAPIFDENARGVFFGMDRGTDRADLAYAVLEGIVFSLYDIGSRIGIKPGGTLITGGGSARDPVMAKLKAELFGRRILHTAENETSALGAAILSMVGGGVFSSLEEAAESLVRYEILAVPTGEYREQLLARFSVYQSLYPSLKENFARFAGL